MIVVLRLDGGTAESKKRPNLTEKEIKDLNAAGFKVDMTEGTDDSGYKEVPRYTMPCGHKYSSYGLRHYVTGLLKTEGCVIPLVCSFVNRKSYACLTKRWDWDMVLVTARLTTEELKEWERYMSENIVLQEMGGARCPECKTVSYRTDSETRVVCMVCKTNKSQNPEFCAKCMRKWQGSKCLLCEDFDQTLQECDEKVVSEMKVPVMRMCPRPHISPMLVEHADLCKHMMCPRCRLFFCFGCLSIPNDKLVWSCGSPYSRCPKIAPRQRV